MNAKLFFVGSDDVPADAKIEATRAINQALEGGWQGVDIAEIIPLDQIARAHELVEHPVKAGLFHAIRQWLPAGVHASGSRLQSLARRSAQCREMEKAGNHSLDSRHLVLQRTQLFP
jgi:hypothetical protein